MPGYQLAGPYLRPPKPPRRVAMGGSDDPLHIFDVKSPSVRSLIGMAISTSMLAQRCDRIDVDEVSIHSEKSRLSCCTCTSCRGEIRHSKCPGSFHVRQRCASTATHEQPDCPRWRPLAEINQHPPV